MAMQMGWLSENGEHSKIIEATNYNLVGRDVEELWGELLGEDEDDKKPESEEIGSEIWKRKLQNIGDEYRNSVRFSLMRYIFFKAGGKDVIDSFSKEIDGKLYEFKDITIDHACAMRPEDKELEKYKDLLEKIADDKLKLDIQKVPDEIREEEMSKRKKEANELIECALETKERKGRKSLLSRSDILKLGHILNFSVDEMEWFMLRTLDFDEKFFYNRSSDLIEVYTFLTQGSAESAKRLKEEYAEKLAESAYSKQSEVSFSLQKELSQMVSQWSIEEREEKFLEWVTGLSNDLIEMYTFLIQGSAASAKKLKKKYAAKLAESDYSKQLKLFFSSQEESHTKSLQSELSQMIPKWSVEEREEKFLEWMMGQSKYLDRPSRTALRIYHNLVKATYDLISNTEKKSILEKSLYELAQEVAVCREDKLQGMNTKKCEEIADKLYSYYSRVLVGDDARDSKKAWGMIRLRDYEFTIGWRFADRERVFELMTQDTGKAKENETIQSYGVQKEDILNLFWVFANTYWKQEPLSNPNVTRADKANVQDKRETAKIKERIEKFKDAADVLLTAALLPQFYEPHVLEESMILSILYSGAFTLEEMKKNGGDLSEAYRICTPACIYQIARKQVIRQRDRLTKETKQQ